MKDKKTDRMLFMTAAAIIAAAVLIIGTAFLIISKGNSRIVFPEFQRAPGEARQVIITANPGGEVPTAIPTTVPEPVQGMDIPLLCKLELKELSDKASECGAVGMLIPGSYDFGRETCIFDVMNTAKFSNSGRIEVFRSKKAGTYGITVKMENKNEDSLQKWSEAALLFFSSSVRSEEAGASVETALREGAAENGQYRISVYDEAGLIGNKVLTLRVLKIENIPDSSENRSQE